MDICIREARYDELLETARIYIECQQTDFPFLPKAYRDNLDLTEEVEECYEWLEKDPLNRVFVAVERDFMIGYLAVAKNTDEPLAYQGEIAGFFVRKLYRRRGIGLRLLEAAVHYFTQVGYPRLLVYTLYDGESDQYYRRLGGVSLKQVTQYFGGEPQLVDVLGWETEVLGEMVRERLHRHG